MLQLKTRSIASTIALLGCLGAVNAVAAGPTDFANRPAKDPRYIYAADVESARGNYQLRVPGVGTFKITAVKARGGKSGQCQVDRASLVDLVRRLGIQPAQSSGGGTTSVKMKATHKPDGTVECQGSSEGCTVIFPTWDPDSPTLPGL